MMTLLVLGMNHETAPLALRERVGFRGDVVGGALQTLRRKRGVDEAAILSTCNRTEIYCALQATGGEKPSRWLSEYHGLKHAEIEPFLYTHPDARAVRHILRVACGLDSMVLGEPQILGQLKLAYQTGLQAGSIGKLLGRLFQHSFSVAKEIRTTTTIGCHPVSVAFVVVRLARQIFGELTGRTALLIGAGANVELIARHLHEHGLRRIIIANRTAERAQKLADKYAALAVPLHDVPRHIAAADVVVASTASELPILGKGLFEGAVKQRRRRPMFVADLAVPRDVEPEVGSLEDVYLYNIDDLSNVIRDNMYNREQAAKQAQMIVEEQVRHFMAWLDSLDAVTTIRAFRARAGALQQETLNAAREELRRGKEPELVLQKATRALANKLMHTPSRQLRAASAEKRNDLLSAAHELFNLDLVSPPPKSDQ